MIALIMGCSKSPVGRTLELEPWFLPRFPVRFFPLGVLFAGFFWPPSDRFYFSFKR